MLRQSIPHGGSLINRVLQDEGQQFWTGEAKTLPSLTLSARTLSDLELIATGKTARSEIESVLEIHAGAYLSKLEGEYALVDRYKPIDAKAGSRLQKYFIRDNFLNFWFRFIYRNLSAVETGNFAYLREIVERDYATWSGRILERFFHELYAASGNYNRIGSYWERGNKNEIDLVAVNDLRKELVIAEIKVNKSRIDLAELEKKAKNLVSAYPGYRVEFRALGVEDAQQSITCGNRNNP